MAQFSDCIDLSSELGGVLVNDLVEKTKTSIQEMRYSQSTIWSYNGKLRDFHQRALQFGTDRLTVEFIAWYIDEGKQRRPKHARSDVQRKALLNVIATTVGCNPMFAFASCADGILSESLRGSLNAFEQHLRNQSKSSETINSYMRIAANLLLYLEKNNVNNPMEITADDIHGFVTELGAKWSPRSMQSVPSPLRAYLRFVAAKAEAILASSFSVPRKSKPVRAMSLDAVEALWGYIKGDDEDLRSKAIVVILLATGIRPIDIANLELDDISWDAENISFLQSKTGECMNIELFPVMGDAIARYITEERPRKTGQRYVFLTSKFPYRRIAPSACAKALKGALEKAGITYLPDGLHCPRALRRSLASRMIAKDIPIQKAAAALGHVGESSIDLYTELDVKRMKSICLPVPESMKGWLMSS
jgi:site-specific recombinase XerD